MPRMIDLIRASAVPANLVQSAARGALAMPPQEMLEILVHLATENKMFSDQARLTLAEWDEAACKTAVSGSGTPRPVLEYFSAPENFRPALFSALLQNSAVPEDSLAALAASIPRNLAEFALDHDSVNQSEKILSAFSTNPNLTGIQSATIDERLALLARSHRPAETSPPHESSPSMEPASIDEISPEDLEADAEVAKYISTHSAEITLEAAKPFQPVGGIETLHAGEESTAAGKSEEPSSEPAVTAAEGASQNASSSATGAKTAPIAKQTRGSVLQRVSQLDVKGRIQLAMKGSKEERALLVRDGTKIVALAVLDSPKISDSEVEKFAGQKNVLEAVLRAIPMKRRFMKQYGIVRNLVFNPRTPIDVSLGLMKNILVPDLKNLSGNKEVSDTVRKLALRMFKQKLTVDK